MIMRLSLFLLFLVYQLGAQRPELSMELFLAHGYADKTPFSKSETLLYKSLRIKEIQIVSSKNCKTIIDVDNEGKPFKSVSYLKKKRRQTIRVDSTVYHYTKNGRLSSKKYRSNVFASVDSFEYDGGRLSRLFFLSNEFDDSDSCNVKNKGTLEDYKLTEQTPHNSIFHFNYCNHNETLILDNSGRLQKLVNGRRVDSVSINKDSTMHWLKLGSDRFELIKVDVISKERLLFSKIKSSQSDNFITKEYSYNHRGQLTSVICKGGKESSFFYTYYNNGLLKEKITLPCEPDSKYNFRLAVTDDVYSIPLEKYNYKTADGQ